MEVVLPIVEFIDVFPTGNREALSVLCLVLCLAVWYWFGIIELTFTVRASNKEHTQQLADTWSTVNSLVSSTLQQAGRPPLRHGTPVAAEERSTDAP